uniref:MBL fold metallo-hydrolase n=1 Tax=Thermomicrobium roseum TaxID=500 RepID=A0A7C1FSX3_THERO
MEPADRSPNAAEIRPEELVTRLQSGEPVLILDIRPRTERQEWAIPHSLWIDLYDAAQRGDFRLLDSLAVPPTSLVVVVCAAGRTSSRVAQELQRRGIRAASLAGGMRAWSLAWDIATLPISSTGQVLQVRRLGKGCLSYLVVDSGEALVIDPSLQPDVYLQLAESLGAKIVGVLETHVHACHVSRGRLLSEAAAAPYRIPATDRVRFAYTPVTDGDVITVGSLQLIALSTPGHTWESTCYLLPDHALFTGDTLFTDGIGRPDLKAGGDERARKARALFDSLQRLGTLSDSLWVLPSHVGTPLAVGEPLVAGRLHELYKRFVAPFEQPDHFVEALLQHLPPPPPNTDQITRANELGVPPSELASLLELEAGPNRCAVQGA